MKINIRVWSYLAHCFLEREMFQTEAVEKIKTHIFIYSNFFENSAVDEIMWKNTVEPQRLQMTKWRMCIACWIPKATNTHAEYVILIDFPLHQWLHERLSVTSYIHCLSSYVTVWRPDEGSILEPNTFKSSLCVTDNLIKIFFFIFM